MSNTPIPSSNQPPAVPPLPAQPDLSVPQNAGAPSPVMQASAAQNVQPAPNQPGSVTPVGTNGQAGLAPATINAITPQVQPEKTASGITKPPTSFGKKMLHAMFSALGVMAPEGQEQYGPHGEDLGIQNYSPGRRAGLGALRFISAMSQGLGQRGPGSVGRAAAAGAQGAQRIVDDDQKQAAELYRQHALTFANYQQTQAQNTEASQQIATRNSPWAEMLDRASDEGLIKSVNAGQPMVWSQAWKEYQDLQKQGYGLRNVGLMQVGTEPAPKTDDNPEGVGTIPTFKVWYNDDPKGIAHQPITFTDEAAALMNAQNGSQLSVLGVVKQANANQATANVDSLFSNMLKNVGMDIKQGPLPANGSQDALMLGTADQQWTSFLAANGKDPVKALDSLQQANQRGWQLFVERRLGGDPTNMQKYAEAMKEQDLRQQEIARDPEKGPVTPALLQTYATTLNMLHNLSDTDRVSYWKSIQNETERGKAEKIIDEAHKRDDALADDQQHRKERMDDRLFEMNYAQTLKDKDQAIAAPNPNGLSGEAYLKTIDASDATFIRALKNGDIPIRRWDMLLRDQKGGGKRLAEELTNAYPPTLPDGSRNPDGFDGSRIEGYLRAQQEFTSGPLGRSLIDLDSLAQHALATYQEAGSYLAVNVPYVSKTRQKYNTDATYLAENIAKFQKGGVADEQSLKYFRDQLFGNPFYRQARIKEAVKRTVETYGAYVQRWKDASPSTAYAKDFPYISKDARNSFMQVLGDEAPDWFKRGDDLAPGGANVAAQSNTNQQTPSGAPSAGPQNAGINLDGLNVVTGR